MVEDKGASKGIRRGGDCQDGPVWLTFEDSQPYQDDQLTRILARVIEFWLEEDDSLVLQ